MIFDRMIKMVEKWLPEYSHLLREAKLFYLPIIPHEVLPKVYTDEQAAFYKENFFLPFPVCAIEDKGGCVLLADRDKNAVGIDHPRTFIDCYALDDMETMNVFDPAVTNLVKLREEILNAPKGSTLVCLGAIKNIEMRGNDIDLRFVVQDLIIGTPEVLEVNRLKGKIAISKMMEKVDARALVGNVKVCIEEITYFNDPQYFVVEKSSPRGYRENRKLIPRTHERPLYTFLRPKQIREEIGLKGEVETLGKKLREGGPRRAHYRTLKSDRFVNKQGQRIPIKSTWVGPTQTIIGNKKYKVLTGLRKEEDDSRT